MKSDRQAKILAIVAITLAIGGLSIGFAAFSTTLNINGTATVQSSSWDVHFENLSAVSLTGATTTEVTAPTLDSAATTISGFDIDLTTPGDSASYTFDVVNDGTFDATVTSLTVAAPVCVSAGDTVANPNLVTEAATVCGNLTYTLTYADDSAINVNDTLDAGQTVSMKLTLTYNADTTAAELPTTNVEVTTLTAAVIYGQA